ncbi:Cysteine desulfurase IscS [uncultured archaeon]|nr:Cysteine desulfurase IscS [uncultured archaeon]
MACNEVFSNFQSNIQKITQTMNYMKNQFVKMFGAKHITDYTPGTKCVFLSSPSSQVMPNTLSVSFVSKCNKKIKDFLEQNDIIIGIGSACEKDKRSHVMEALRLPNEVSCGVLRISINENTNQSHIDKLLALLSKVYA